MVCETVSENKVIFPDSQNIDKSWNGQTISKVKIEDSTSAL